MHLAHHAQPHAHAWEQAAPGGDCSTAHCVESRCSSRNDSMGPERTACMGKGGCTVHQAPPRCCKWTGGPSLVELCAACQLGTATTHRQWQKQWIYQPRSTHRSAPRSPCRTGVVHRCWYGCHRKVQQRTGSVHAQQHSSSSSSSSSNSLLVSDGQHISCCRAGPGCILSG
jgi:hypothetical protein